MEQTYLPGTIRDRIQDLMKSRKVTQAELAARIGCSESMLSRFISGKTDKLGDENIIRIARAFNVSTDFLLGVADVPDRKNYSISELGLSAQAARNLYTGKANAAIVSCLLENPRFANLTYLIEQYLDDTIASGYAAQNALYGTLSGLLRKTSTSDAAGQVAQSINRMKVPPYQADLTNIQNQFVTAVKEVKKEVGADFSAVQKLSEDVMERMFYGLTKRQDVETAEITPELISAAVTGAVSGMDGVNAEALSEFGQALTKLMQTTLDQAAMLEKEHESPDQ